MPSKTTRSKRAVPFDQLPSKAAKRRAICADAIAQLRRGSLKAETGVFVRLPSSALDSGAALSAAVEANPNLTVKTLLATHQVKECQCCALGALMMGQFRVNGDCKVADLDRSRESDNDARLTPFANGAEDTRGNSVFSPFVLRYFSVAQLQLIEVAFEGGSGAFSCWDAAEDWQEWGDKDTFDCEAQSDGWLFTVRQASAAIAFGKRFRSDKGRLTAILQSIIEHPKALFAPVVRR